MKYKDTLIEDSAMAEAMARESDRSHTAANKLRTLTESESNKKEKENLLGISVSLEQVSQIDEELGRYKYEIEKEADTLSEEELIAFINSAEQGAENLMKEYEDLIRDTQPLNTKNERDAREKALADLLVVQAPKQLARIEILRFVLQNKFRKN